MKTHNHKVPGKTKPPKPKMHSPIVPEDAKLPRPEFEIRFEGEFNYPNQPAVRVNMSTDAETLQDILLVFEDFLKGMGFHINGYLDVVNDEEA